MPKVEIDVPLPYWEILQKVSDALGLPIEELAKQEIVDSLSVADVWLQRAELLI